MRFACLTLLAFVSACQTAYKDGQPNENSPNYKIPVDSRLILHRDVTIPTKTTSIWFQRGQILPRYYQVNRYGTYCEFEISTKRNVRQTVKADEFLVYEVKRETLIGHTGFIQLASSGVLARLLKRQGGYRQYEVVATRLALRSETQPDVQSLTCASWEAAQAVSYLTLRKIRNTLGDIGTLELAEGPQAEL